MYTTLRRVVLQTKWYFVPKMNIKNGPNILQIVQSSGLRLTEEQPSEEGN